MFADLVDTDLRYFASAAAVSTAAGYTLAVMPGLQDLPAGCVGTSVDTGTTDVHAVIDDFEQRVRAADAALFRLYVDSESPS